MTTETKNEFWVGILRFQGRVPKKNEKMGGKIILRSKFAETIFRSRQIHSGVFVAVNTFPKYTGFGGPPYEDKEDMKT